jgi:hypothetical protein
LHWAHTQPGKTFGNIWKGFNSKRESQEPGDSAVLNIVIINHPFIASRYALRKAESELFRPDRGARKDATKVIVLFTDGLSIDDPLKPAQQLRELKHVKIFVVSVGTDSFRPELNRIAGHEENMFG